MSYDKNNSDWRPTRLSGSNGNGDGLPPFDVEAIIRYIKDKFDLIPFFKSYGSVYIILRSKEHILCFSINIYCSS